ncbi:cell division protein [Adhaeribacter aerolatus]|uniref:Cell division protein n=1 Tax=Adhaeribacter aerolatus TaxID=670289 RepID=A0A512AVA7_9BACT|nr:SPOR domain-containing protein [Adhaeribacter aerolatus]GEO03651.1 cell division protein [Adhaeribacter aerolatus]
MVEEHINKLLFEHDCVIIPDFGGLITHYAPARIHPVKNTLTPPSKRIAFNEKLKLNDGLLISTLAYERKLTTEAAQTEVNAFVRQLQDSLLQHQRHELKGIGIFRYNAAQKLEFDYVPADNFLNDSFGLPELLARPLETPDAANSLRTLLQEKRTEQPAPLTTLTWRRRLRKIYDTAAVVVIAGLSVTALYVLSLQNEYSQSSLNPFAVLNIAANTVAPKPATLEEQITAIYPEETPAEFTATDNISPINSAATEEIKSTEVESTPETLPTAESPASAGLVETNKNVAASKTEKLKTENANSAAVAIVAVPAVAPAKKLGINIKEATDRYYVIAGGYSTLPKADYSRKVANRFGAQGRIIFPFGDGKLYRVSIADFDSKEEALVYLPKLKINYGKNIWILKY